MTFKYRYRKQLILATTIIILLILLSIGIYKLTKNSSQKEKPTLTLTNLSKKQEKDSPKTNKNKELAVDIKGEIINPGIYHLKEGSRVTDVIEKAGGLTEQANTTVINLSKKIVDEMVIIIYSNEEVKNFQKTKEKEQLLQEKCNQKEENALKNDACINPTNTIPNKPTGKISLNQATKEELMSLPGIGEAKAEDIINYRTSNNGFKTLEELKNIKGIGDSIFDKIKENITL